MKEKIIIAVGVIFTILISIYLIYTGNIYLGIAVVPLIFIHLSLISLLKTMEIKETKKEIKKIVHRLKLVQSYNRPTSKEVELNDLIIPSEEQEENLV